MVINILSLLFALIILLAAVGSPSPRRLVKSIGLRAARWSALRAAMAGATKLGLSHQESLAGRVVRNPLESGAER